MTKSVWDDADPEVQKAATVLQKIRRGIKRRGKPLKPLDLLKPVIFDLSFYLTKRDGHPKRIKDPSEGSEGTDA